MISISVQNRSMFSHPMVHFCHKNSIFWEQNWKKISKKNKKQIDYENKPMERQYSSFLHDQVLISVDSVPLVQNLLYQQDRPIPVPVQYHLKYLVFLN